MIYYKIEGLPAREERLLEFYIRLLESQLEHQWEISAQEVDVVFYGVREPVDIPALALSKSAPRARFSIFVTKHDSDDIFGLPVLRLPLHSEGIRNKLNKIGVLISESKARAFAPIQVDLTKAYRLIRWPSHHLLKSPNAVRLASLMTRQFMSIEMLHRRTGAQKADCKQLITTLFTQNLLHVATKPIEPYTTYRISAMTHASEKSFGLASVFGMIRRKLFLQK